MKKIILMLIANFGLGLITLAQNNCIISGGHVNMVGNTYLVLYNTRFLNSGSFNADTATVSIVGNGTDAQSAVGGDSATTFYNLRLEKSMGGTQLLQQIQVDSQLQLVNGNLDLNGFNLTLGTALGMIMGETDTSRVLGPNGGFIQKTATLGIPNFLNVGNLGCSILSFETIGTTTIRRGHVPQTVYGSTQGINRFYEFESGNDSLNTVLLRLSYLDAEVNEPNEFPLRPYRQDQDDSMWFQTIFQSLDSNINQVRTIVNLLTKLTLAPGSSQLYTSVFLEGPYVDSLSSMTDDLRTNNQIPLQSPYTEPMYSFGAAPGEEVIDPAILNRSEIDAVVDWIYLALRDPNIPGNPVVYARSGLILVTGAIVDLDGYSPLAFPGVPNGSYLYSIRHRNHVGILSTQPLSFADQPSIYFRPLSNSIFNVQGTFNAMKQYPSGIFAMYSGDFNSNGQIQIDDGTNLLPFIGQSGYLIGDFNLNGEVQNDDLQSKLFPNIGRGAQYVY